MNVNFVKGLVIFVIGFGLGAVAAKMALKREYEELVQEEVESLRETAARRKGIRKASSASKVFNDNGEAIIDGLKKGINDSSNAKNHYKKMAEQYAGETDLDHIRDRHNVTHYEGGPDCTPYAISLEEFSEEMDNFEKSTIYYYDEDDTLADEQEEMIQDVLAIIGPIVLDHLQQAKSDVVYVRNEKMQIDYEIIVLDKSYGETVSGIIPEE